MHSYNIYFSAKTLQGILPRYLTVTMEIIFLHDLDLTENVWNVYFLSSLLISFVSLNWKNGGKSRDILKSLYWQLQILKHTCDIKTCPIRLCLDICFFSCILLEHENEVGILIILVLLYLAVEQEFMKMVFRAVVIQSLIAVVAVVYNMQGNVDGLKLQYNLTLAFLSFENVL